MSAETNNRSRSFTAVGYSTCLEVPACCIALAHSHQDHRCSPTLDEISLEMGADECLPTTFVVADLLVVCRGWNFIAQAVPNDVLLVCFRLWSTGLLVDVGASGNGRSNSRPDSVAPSSAP